MQLISLMGNSQKLDAGAMFGNAPKVLWSRWVETDDKNRMHIECRCLLAIGLNGQNVLFETGIGAFFDPKMKSRFGVNEDSHVLLESLAEHGLNHKDIDVVVLSHLHFDHAGGLLSQWQEGKDLGLLFPNAKYLVSAEHWQRAIKPHPRDRASFIPHLNQLLLESERLELVSGPFHELLPSVRFEYSHGHTPGMMHAVIDEKVVFCADLIPGKAWMHVPISMGYDRFPELLIDEKSQFLHNHFSDKRQLFFTHDPEIALSGIEYINGRYSTKDEILQLNKII